MNPLYSQQLTIGANGLARLSMVGGSPFKKEDSTGYLIPPPYGLLNLFSPHNAPEILQCVATISAYQDHPVEVVSLPGQVLIDVPCSIEIAGPVGTEILLQVWPTCAVQSRGGKRSYYKDTGAGTLSGLVPLWANTFDFGGGANVLFYRDSSLVVPTGFALGAAPIVGMSIPSGSGWFVTTSVTPALSMMFRQQ